MTEFLKAVKRRPGIIGTNVGLVCEYGPENIPFNFVQWTYSRLNNIHNRVKVYHYDRGGWAQSFEHLTGRSSHKHTHNTIELDLIDTNVDDDGIYYCTYGGISPKTANLTYTAISDMSKCLQLDSRLERTIQVGDDIVIQASSKCCKPPVRFLWSGVDSTLYSLCADQFQQSTSYFTRRNIRQDFTVTLTAQHPSGDLSVEYRVKDGSECGAEASGAAKAAKALGALLFVALIVIIIFSIVIYRKGLCSQQADGRKLINKVKKLLDDLKNLKESLGFSNNEAKQEKKTNEQATDQSNIINLLTNITTECGAIKKQVMQNH